VSNGIVRLATDSDATAIQSIYAPVVRETAISFELEPPTVDEIRARIAKTRESELPWLVLDIGGVVTGYVYAAHHRGDRPAYRWSVEVSIYMHPDARGRGLGRTLYVALFSVLAFQHIQNAYAGATLPNPASVALHEALGFKRVGVYEEVGYKFGKWHDTIWWVKRLGAHAVPAPDIVPLSQALTMPDFPIPMQL
jgi:phosphinothricin acetyltransferase